MKTKNNITRITYKVSEIVWDTDEQESDPPSECLIDVMVNSNTTEEDIEESISNAITDMRSYCHKGFRYEVNQ